MKTLGIVLLCATTLVLGVVAGAAVVWGFGTNAVMHNNALAAAAGVGSKTYMLNALRTGETAKATEMLESLLDGDLVTLSVLPEDSFDQHMKSAVAKAAAYRAQYPYKSNEPIVAEAVSRVLTQHAKPAASRK
jgi:hypothetical protein